jgi:maleate cis-trans isomerase
MSFTLGTDMVQRSLSEGYPNVITTDMATAVSRAISEVGGACARVALVTPYLDEIHRRNVVFLEEEGFDVVCSDNFGLRRDSETSAVTPEAILDRAAALVDGYDGGRRERNDAEKDAEKDVDDLKVDVVFMGCSAMRVTGFGFIDAAEARLGTENHRML